ncbi:MAG: EI24 domain-containing protein [Bacteroidales bacterium]|nr:EI24 domain-containing protein [Bacteroidales bacterium]
MNFIEDISESFSLFFKAIPFTFKHFKWFLLVPFILFLVILYSMYLLESSLYKYFSDIVFSSLNLQNATHWFFKALTFLLQGILFLLFKALFFFIFYFFSGTIVLIILSPVLSYVSEKTEKILSSKSYTFRLKTWLYQIGRSLLLSMRNLFLQTLLVISITIVSFIPIVGWIISPVSIILIILINAYFFGFSFLDFSFERKELTIHQSIQIVRRNKGHAIGFGLIYYAIFLIPIIGSFLAPFVSLFVVVAATMAVEKMILHD